MPARKSARRGLNRKFRRTEPRGSQRESVGSVIKKRRKKMRKHKKRKLLRRARHKRKR